MRRCVEFISTIPQILLDLCRESKVNLTPKPLGERFGYVD